MRVHGQLQVALDRRARRRTCSRARAPSSSGSAAASSNARARSRTCAARFDAFRRRASDGTKCRSARSRSRSSTCSGGSPTSSGACTCRASSATTTCGPPPDEVSHARIEELARLIERMGSVNLDAMREHEEAERRFEFYTTQKADLEKALADLTRAIQQMNRESRRLFEETFEAVNSASERSFRACSAAVAPSCD